MNSPILLLLAWLELNKKLETWNYIDTFYSQPVPAPISSSCPTLLNPTPPHTRLSGWVDENLGVGKRLHWRAIEGGGLMGGEGREAVESELERGARIGWAENYYNSKYVKGIDQISGDGWVACRYCSIAVCARLRRSKVARMHSLSAQYSVHSISRRASPVRNTLGTFQTSLVLVCSSNL